MVAFTLVTLAGAYLLGSIPTGYLVGRARGVDLRQAGSGNIGATNALRVLGKPAGIFVLIVDALKGVLAATVVPRLAWQNFATSATSDATAGMPVWLPILAGIAAVLGHNFTVWLRFRGGKGVATSAGVLLGVLPLPFLMVLAVFLLALAITRVVSLSSLVAAAALPPAAWWSSRQPLLLAFAVALSGLIFVRHRANIRRILAGTEPRLGQKAASPPGPAST